MLFDDCAQEDPRFCIESAKEMRDYLITELQKLGDSSALLDHLRAIRAAARKFMDHLPPGLDDRFHSSFGPSLQQLGFFMRLGELRATVGMQVALLATKWGVDVEHDLARVLPSATQ